MFHHIKMNASSRIKDKVFFLVHSLLFFLLIVERTSPLQTNQTMPQSFDDIGRTNGSLELRRSQESSEFSLNLTKEISLP